jgi:hypothetical protein
LLQHTVPSVSTDSILMSTNSAVIQGEQPINEESAVFLLPITSNSINQQDSSTSDTGSKSISKDTTTGALIFSEGSFPPNSKQELERDYSSWVQKTYSQRGYSEVKSDDAD